MAVAAVSRLTVACALSDTGVSEVAVAAVSRLTVACTVSDTGVSEVAVAAVSGDRGGEAPVDVQVVRHQQRRQDHPRRDELRLHQHLRPARRRQPHHATGGLGRLQQSGTSLSGEWPI